MIKVCIDNTSFFPIVGGTETYCYQLMQYANPEEVQFKMVCQFPEQGLASVRGHEVVRVGAFALQEGYVKESAAVDRALGLFKRIQHKKEALERYNALDRQYGIGRYYDEILSFDPDIVLVNDLMRLVGFPYLQLLPYLHEKVQIVVNFHGILSSFGAFWESHPERKKLVQQFFAAAPASIRYLCPSDFVYETALAWGVQAAQLDRIYLGVDTATFKPMQEPSKPRLDATSQNRTVTIGFPSRAVGHKGVDVALRALDLVRQTNNNWKFLIAGGSSANPESIAETHQLIDQFASADQIVLGIDQYLKYPEDMVRFYNSCDFCLFPSRRDVFGFAAVESMACAIPVIGTSIPGLNEALGVPIGAQGDCPGGWVVLPEDHLALAKIILQLLEKPELVRQKRLAARQWVEQNFSVEKMVEKHLEFFQHTIRSF